MINNATYFTVFIYQNLNIINYRTIKLPKTMHIPWHPKVISNLENIRTLNKLSKNDKNIIL